MKAIKNTICVRCKNQAACKIFPNEHLYNIYWCSNFDCKKAHVKEGFLINLLPVTVNK